MPHARHAPSPDPAQTRFSFDFPDGDVVEREVAEIANDLPRPTISQVLRIAWPNALAHLLHPRDGVYSDELRDFVRRGHVEITNIPWSPDVVILQALITWNRSDEIRCDTINRKVSFVTRLIESVLTTHDRELCQRLRTAMIRDDFRRAHIAMRYHYVFGPIEPRPASFAFVARVETAVRFR